MAFSEKEKKYAMIAGGLVGAVVLYTMVIDPYYTEYKDTRAKITDARAKDATAETLFSTEQKKHAIWTTMLAEGMKTRLEEAQSQAQGAIHQWASGSGVNVSETHMEAVPRQENKFLITTFKFTGIGSTRSISRWLLAIEKGTVPAAPPSQVAGRIPLRIDDLVVTPRKPGTDDLQAVVTLSTLCLIPDASDNIKTKTSANGPVALGQ